MLTFSEALAQAEQLARQALDPALHDRLRRAVTLVRQGSVFEDDAGTWTVASATTPDKRYTVNGSCACEDAFYQAPQGRCQHKLAQLLARKVQALMQLATGEGSRSAPEPRSAPSATADTSQGPAGLPEAPVSVNVRVLFAGHEVQLTLRGMSEGEVLTRLQALLKRPDVRPLPKPAPKSGSWKRSYQGR